MFVGGILRGEKRGDRLSIRRMGFDFKYLMQFIKIVNG